MICNFSIDHYEFCLQKIKKSTCINLMIHDIDIWTDHMSNILDLEIKYNISSIWFFRFHAKNYNLLSYNNIAFLQQFKNLTNIECGLHIEPFYLKQFNIIQEQIKIIEKIIDKKIKYASVHEPTRFNFNVDENLLNLKLISYKECQNANIKYISDSSSNWREGCMCNHINAKDLIILTHPNWWYREYSGEIY